jgi:RNA polymerase sigma factor (sigma-70 family)
VSNVVALRRPLPAALAVLVEDVLCSGAVEKLARPLSLKYAGMIMLDDLVQLGREGLLQAAPKYKEEEGAFLPFARCRIRGAMYDGIRLEAFEARVTRAGVRAADEVLAFYRDDYDVLHHDADELQRRLDRFSDATLVATLLAEVSEAQKACSPDELAEQEEYCHVRELLRGGVRELPAKQQRVLVLLFTEGHTQEEAAVIMGRDVSTVRRNQKAAIERLRKWMSFHGIEMLPDPADVPEAEEP